MEMIEEQLEQCSVGVPYICDSNQEWGALRVREYQWDNGNVYIGQTVDTMMEGFGTLICVTGSTYTGMWRRNKMHGKGSRRYENGDIYIGNYKEGKRHGYGKYYFRNGDVYDGEWKENKIDKGMYYRHYNTKKEKCLEQTLCDPPEKTTIDQKMSSHTRNVRSIEEGIPFTAANELQRKFEGNHAA